MPPPEQPTATTTRHQTDLLLDEPKAVAGTGATAVLREPRPDGSGLRRIRVVVTWPDGAIDDHEGKMPVTFESHGYRFTLEGLRHMASLEVEPLE